MPSSSEHSPWSSSPSAPPWSRGAVDFGLVAVALAFGLVLVFAAYAFGPVSGCHINPAVTIAMITTRRIDALVGGLYVVVQFLGGIAGAFVLWLSVEYFDVVDQTGALGSNGYGAGDRGQPRRCSGHRDPAHHLLRAGRAASHRQGRQRGDGRGLGIGAALAAVHLIGIGLTGTSVNPARSFGPALFAGGTALEQVWVFLLAPAVGGLLAAVIYPLTRAGQPALAVDGEAVA